MSLQARVAPGTRLPPAFEARNRDTLLRPLSIDDADLYVRIYTDPQLMQQVATVLTADAAARAFAAALRFNLQILALARYWVLLQAHSGDRIGLLGLLAKGDGEGAADAELGAMVLPECQGRGHAAAAIGTLADWVFSCSGLTRLHTRHDTANAGAARLMRKLGFQSLPSEPTQVLACRWQLTRESWRRACLQGNPDSPA